MNLTVQKNLGRCWYLQIVTSEGSILMEDNVWDNNSLTEECEVQGKIRGPLTHKIKEYWLILIWNESNPSWCIFKLFYHAENFEKQKYLDSSMVYKIINVKPFRTPF